VLHAVALDDAEQTVDAVLADPTRYGRLTPR
jgi:hypothetical protein